MEAPPHRPLTGEVLDLLRATDYMELVTTGRRTGLPRPVQLSFAHRGGELYLLAHPRSQWVRNLRASPAAEARVGPLRLAVEAEFPGDARATLELALQLFAAKYGRDYVRAWYEGTGRIPLLLRVRRWARA